MHAHSVHGAMVCSIFEKNLKKEKMRLSSSLHPENGQRKRLKLSGHVISCDVDRKSKGFTVQYQMFTTVGTHSLYSSTVRHCVQYLYRHASQYRTAVYRIFRKPQGSSPKLISTHCTFGMGVTCLYR